MCVIKACPQYVHFNSIIITPCIKVHLVQTADFVNLIRSSIPLTLHLACLVQLLAWITGLDDRFTKSSFKDGGGVSWRTLLSIVNYYNSKPWKNGKQTREIVGPFPKNTLHTLLLSYTSAYRASSADSTQMNDHFTSAYFPRTNIRFIVTFTN